MLGRRRAQADAGPSYAVIWANLRKRFPGVRTVLITAASTGDDASVAALGLAEAAVSLDDSSALVLVLHSAMRNGRLPNAPGASVRMIPALSASAPTVGGVIVMVMSAMHGDLQFCEPQ